MILALLLAAMLPASGGAPLEDPIPLAIQVGAPDELAGEVALVNAAFAETLRERTPFEPSSAEALGYDPQTIERCREEGSLVCLLRVGWRDILQITLRADGADRMRVAVLLLRPTPEDRLRASTSSIADDQLDAALFARAIVLERELSRGDAGALGATARELCERLAAPRVGTLLVEAESEGARVSIDNVAVGVITGGRLVVPRVKATRHRVRLAASARSYAPIDVDVRTGTTTIVVARASPDPEPDPLPLFGGIGLAAAGVALTVVASAAPANQRICLGPCDGGFVGFGEGAGDGTKVLIAPLGLGLIVSGASWATTRLWLGDDERSRWLGLAVALIAGAGVYAITASVGA